MLRKENCDFFVIIASRGRYWADWLCIYQISNVLGFVIVVQNFVTCNWFELLVRKLSNIFFLLLFFFFLHEVLLYPKLLYVAWSHQQSQQHNFWAALHKSANISVSVSKRSKVIMHSKILPWVWILRSGLVFPVQCLYDVRTQSYEQNAFG